MLSQLKETLSGKKTSQLSSDLKKVKKEQGLHSEIITSVKSDLHSIKSTISILVAEQKQMLRANTEALQLSRDLKEDLTESINSVKLISSTIQNNLIKKITEDVNNLTQEISTKLSGSESLKRELDDAATKVKNELNQLNGEIIKMKSIMSNIKAEDFELTKFAHQLTNADNEKLRLMREIDTLQRLVSSLRRRH